MSVRDMWEEGCQVRRGWKLGVGDVLNWQTKKIAKNNTDKTTTEILKEINHKTVRIFCDNKNVYKIINCDISNTWQNNNITSVITMGMVRT